jgi:hypothetical protein
VVDFALREHRAVTVEHRGQQLHLPAVGASGAAQRLAVDRDRRQLLVAAGAGLGGSAGQPAAEHPVQLVRVDREDRPAQGRLVRCDVPAGHRMRSGAQPGECLLGQLGGELPNRDEALGARQCGSGRDRQQ